MIPIATTLRASQVSCSQQRQTIFTNISFELAGSEMLLVTGPNGSGKSSLLRLLTGLTTPTAGDIHWCDTTISVLGTDYWQELHYLGHANGIKLGLTAMENLQLTTGLSAEKIADVLHILQLSAHQHRQAKYLSAGQKRRIALAKLFLLPKKLWILDEPCTALDTHVQSLFFIKLTEHLNQQGIAIISSHQPLAIPTAHVKTLELGIC